MSRYDCRKLSINVKSTVSFVNPGKVPSLNQSVHGGKRGKAKPGRGISAGKFTREDTFPMASVENSHDSAKNLKNSLIFPGNCRKVRYSAVLCEILLI